MRQPVVFQCAQHQSTPGQERIGVIRGLALLGREMTGELDGDAIHTPGIYVDRIVQGNFEKRIEQRTVRQRENA